MDTSKFSIEDLKNLKDMIDEVLSDIIKANVGITNVSNSSVTRTLTGALLSQLAMANAVLKALYASMDIDNATGNDLDRLVSILSVYRGSATVCTSQIDFCKPNGATRDIPIQEGTIVSSKKDNNGNIIRFKTTQYAYLPSGSTKVTVPIECIEPGNVILAPNSVVYMESPIMGIESVTNSSPISGGSNKESDASLRARAKLALSKIGSATNPGLKGALLELDEVEDVQVLDMNRGVGTTDISIMCTSMPPSKEVSEKIDAVISKSKASGIYAQAIYPTINYIDITLTIQLKNVIKDKNTIDYTGIRKAVTTAIKEHMSGLGIGYALIINGLKADIMSSHDDIYDILDMTPSNNIQCNNTQIIRCNNININIDGEKHE